MCAFGSIQLWEAIKEALGKTGLCLHSHFDSFERAESHVGKYFSRCAAKKVDEAAVRVWHGIGIESLEILIEAESAAPLSSISKELAGPASGEGRRALFS